ncbi:MAG TPA: MarC family protein [Ktedonobacteraceae bacterium]|jgi:multiple antibiotic resistance protein
MDKSIPLPLAWDQILTILFVVFNPLKVVGPFATLTRGTDQAFCKQLAWRAILLAAIGVVIAGILGQRIWANWGIRDAILLLAGGIIWFLVALLMVLQPSIPALQRDPVRIDQPSLALAFKPLAFPTIVTPYGIATFIVLMATMQTIGQQGVVLGLTGAILLLNWAAMIFARPILRLLATPLELISWVLGVLQVAIGLDLIYVALLRLSVIPT